MSLKHKIVHGLSWSFASRTGYIILQLAFSIVLSRLLDPDEFGIVGMLLVLTGFAQALAEGGLNSALIQNQRATERHSSTVFWIQFSLGGLLSALFFRCAPLIAEFFATPILEPLTRLVSCIFLIEAAGNVHRALFSKEFQFQKLSAINLLSTALSGCVAISFALCDYGVWALAWQLVAFSTINTGLLWIHSAWRPRFIFDFEAAADLGRYSIYLLGYGALNYWLRNADNLLIGRFLGSHQLGIYARAYQLMMLPASNLVYVVGQVMFPALTRVQDDLPRFKRTYVHVTSTIAFIAFPLMAGMASLSEPLVIVLFGHHWKEVVPIIRVLSLVGLFQSIVAPVGWIFTALGKTKAQFVLSLFLAPAFLVAMAVGLRFGLQGISFAYAVWALFGGLLHLHVAGKYLGLTALDVLIGVARIAAMAAIMGITVFGLDITFFSTLSSAVRLLAGISIGFTCYLSLCLLMNDPTLATLTRIAFEFFRSGK